MTLSKSKKEEILKAIIKYRFGDAKRDFESMAKNHVLEKIALELKGYPLVQCSEFIYKKNTAYISDSKEHRNYNISINLGMPLPVKHNNCWHFYGSESEVFANLLRHKVKLEKQIEDAEFIIKGVLNSCTTDKQLLTAIPELEPVIRPFITSSPTALVSIESINAVKKLLS